MLTKRWIQGSELSILEPILAERGWASLNDVTCRALCIFDDDQLIAFHVLQLFPHAEPMWIHNDYRGRGIPEQLADDMMEFLADVKVRGFMVVADNPAVIRLCEAHGMRRVNAPVYIM